MNIIEKDRCVGCMSCLQACPRHCIKAVEDVQGNLYPKIDNTMCIQCMKCKAVCPELNSNLLSFKASKKVYASWSLNKECRSSSASGGIAAELYRMALEQGYWICGVEYGKDFHAVHTVTNNPDSIKCFQQSKYVYSETRNVYSEIKKCLENGNDVLFISLPCKVAGLKAFLGKEYQNLIVIDIVCHGTPPYKQMAEHILSIDKNRKAKHLSFRSDNEFIFKLSDDSNTILYNKSAADDEYLSAFLNGLNYRDSCYHCKYAKPERISDLTICDFWGLGKVIPFEHPYSGAISAVLVNTSKGEDFFSKCQEALFLEERPVDEAVEGNTQLRQPAQIHPSRDGFLREYPQIGFKKAVRICLKKEMKLARIMNRKKKYKSVLRKAVGFVIPHYRD